MVVCFQRHETLQNQRESLSESVTLRTELTDVTLVSEDTVDFTDETLAIDDTHGDDVRGGDQGAGHGGWQGGR